MGWEKRRGTRAYYRKIREGGRVRSIYCGTGKRGEQAAREDEERRRSTAPAYEPSPVLLQDEGEPEIDYSGYSQVDAMQAVIDCYMKNQPIPAGLAARRRELEEQRTQAQRQKYPFLTF
jgi:hypothetical protein